MNGTISTATRSTPVPPRLRSPEDHTTPTGERAKVAIYTETKYDNLIAMSFLDAQTFALLFPPKGDKDSWQKLTRAYADNTKALAAAAAGMDKDAAKAASEKIGKSCDACHMAHRK